MDVHTIRGIFCEWRCPVARDSLFEGSGRLPDVHVSGGTEGAL